VVTAEEEDRWSVTRDQRTVTSGVVDQRNGLLRILRLGSSGGGSSVKLVALARCL